MEFRLRAQITQPGGSHQSSWISGFLDLLLRCAWGVLSWYRKPVMNHKAALGRISVIERDITKQQVDAIVNPANMTLLAGAGGDGATHRPAGRALRQQCLGHAGCY